MPELPEVEVVCRSLRKVLLGRRIQGFETDLPKMLKEPAADEDYFREHLTGQAITDIARRGKYILIYLEKGDILTVHLRMTGKLLYVEQSVPRGKHAHILMPLDDAHELRFDDVRQFGAFYLTAADQLKRIEGLATLGAEPLEDDFTAECLRALLADKRQKLKAFLLDQHNIAGIGNIYADEILFQAGLHPETLAAQVTAEEDIFRLWQAIRDRLTQGIAGGGSSIKDYVDALGQSGSFQEQHRVYGRAGQRCAECGGIIEKIKVCGRTTCFCPNCQPRG